MSLAPVVSRYRLPIGEPGFVCFTSVRRVRHWCKTQPHQKMGVQTRSNKGLKAPRQRRDDGVTCGLPRATAVTPIAVSTMPSLEPISIRSSMRASLSATTTALRSCYRIRVTLKL